MKLGVYEITKKQIGFDLGYSIDTVSKLILSVQEAGKIRYNEKTCEMAIKNWNKYNGNESKLVKVLTDKESANIKDKSLIQYLYSTDTVSIHNHTEEGEEAGEEAGEGAKEKEQEKCIGTRKLKFADTLKIYVGKYSKEMIRAFYDYWTEPTPSKNKMRFELERTWSVELRLSNWSRKEKPVITAPSLKPYVKPDLSNF